MSPSSSRSLSGPIKTHIGGYRVCEKWLKDRRGRTLSYDDLTHCQAVSEARPRHRSNCQLSPDALTLGSCSASASA